MRVRHPYALDDDAPDPDATVHWGGRRRWAEVSDDGTFAVPDDAEHTLDAWAEGYGYALSELVVADAEADSGGGSDDATRDPDSDDAVDAGVCPWCDDYDGDHVAQHASSAHPDEWADYKED